MFHTPKVLLLTGDGDEKHKLEEIFDSHARLVSAGNLPEMASCLAEGDWDLLLCDWPFYSRDWRNILEVTEKFCPDLPVIVLSRTGGDLEWIEALESGAFDLLSWPSPKPAILAAVEQATASLEARKIHGFETTVAPAQYAS